MNTTPRHRATNSSDSTLDPDSQTSSNHDSTRTVEDSVLAEINRVVLDAAEAVHQLALTHANTHAVMSAHVQELAEILAGSTLDWTMRWPA